MADECCAPSTKVGNPSLYCVETEDSFSSQQVQSEEPKNEDKEAKDKSSQDSISATFDIVKATQYGVFDRVLHLLDVEKVEVNARDSENVTLLHWAAINNRFDFLKRFSTKFCSYKFFSLFRFWPIC